MLIKLFFCFFIYSMIGWATEVVFCFIVDDEIVNRGFLKGPVCPIYGVGAILTIVLLGNMKGKWGVIFLLGAILASIIEYVTACILEWLFKTKWWDYSNNKFNIHGRVCLINSVLFGLLALILIEFVHPLMLKVLNNISKDFLLMLVFLFFIVFFIDLYKCVKALLSINKKVYKLEKILDDLKKENLESSSIIIKNNLKEKFNKKIFISRREKTLIKAFPKVSHKKYDESFKKLKNIIKKKE